MQLSHCQPRSKPKKSRIKTLCTLDTFDYNFADSYYRKGKENDQRLRNCLFASSQGKSTTNKKTSTQHHRSQFSAYNCSRIRENSNNKGKRAMSISQSAVNRVRTDHSEFELNGSRPTGATLKKKLVFPTEETYKFDCWQVVRAIIETKQEEVMQGYQQTNKKEKCVMIKTKNAAIKREYQREIKACTYVQKGMKPKQKGLFLRVRKVFKEKKEWMIATDNFYHASWHNDQFYMFVSQLKSTHSQVHLVVKELAKAVEILSRDGYVHTAIAIENLYFPISKGELQAEMVKLGGLRHCFRVESKESFLSMPTLFRTPPEILNFISFECKEEFERDYLDVIGRIEAGWQIDVWSMGVLILEILNGGTLSGEGSDRGHIISLQKELPIRYSYLLANMQGRLRALVVQMLNADPSKRPHPRQILRML